MVLPLSDLMTRQSIYEKLRFLRQSQFWTREQLDAYQDEKLRRLVVHAANHVPYYKELFSKLKLDANDIATKKDLQKLPILAKVMIKEQGSERFTSSAISKKKMVKSSSSGSTGEPLFFYRTREAYSMNLAANLRGWYWMGFRLGDKYVKLSQNARKNPLKRLQDRMSRNLYLATNPLLDANFDHILKEIERYKPKYLRCYPDPLLFLARYKLAHPEFSYKPLAITSTGNTLHPETREEIEAAFGCKIFDSYNCEGNSVVFECPNHSCYHSAEEYGISEVLDDNGNTVTSGTGRLISTDLCNFAHPFIRYDTQDYVEVDDTPCACGRKLFRISKILGRDNEVLVMESGRRFIVHNFTGFFQVDTPQLNRSVDQFQVVKKKNGTVLFRLVVNDKFKKSMADYIRLYWEGEFQTRVIIEKVAVIPFTASGKRRFVLNENGDAH